MKVKDVGTMFVGTDKYALRIAEMVNEKTAVAVHVNDDGTCFHFDDGFPFVEILRMKADGKWYAGKNEFIVGKAENYSDQSF